jgi:hypothetical protein
MPLVTKAIPNLFNGISQQPATLRLASQSTAQDNAFSSVANGLSKRNPTEFLSILGESTGGVDNKTFYSFVDRGGDNKFLLIIENLEGVVTPKLSRLSNGEVLLPTISADALSYLTTDDPKASLVALTVADFTFLVNKTKLAAMSDVLSTGTLKGTKARFSDLPTPTSSPAPVDGDTWEIMGVDGSIFDNFYVKYDSARVVWVETIKPDLLTTIDAATIPVALRPDGVGGFEILVNSWVPRLAGDNVSVAIPSFIGKKISDIFFYRNRLGFIADENIILSRSGDFFNFWSKSARTQLDDDPIDVAVSHNKVSTLNYAVPFNTVLLLFSAGVQFQLTSQTTLTPKTVNVTQITEFDSRAEVRPVVAGQSLYFAVDRQPWTSVKEYYVEPLTYTNNSIDTTAHCPQYIPEGAGLMSTSTADDIVSVQTVGQSNALYVYKYYAGQDKVKLQSAWSRWTFNDAVVQYHIIHENMMYVVLERNGIATFERMALAYGGVEADLPFLVCLDRKIEQTGVYDAVTNKTTWTLPTPYAGAVTVVYGGTFASTLRGVKATTYKVNDTTIEAVGNQSAGQMYIGEPYRFSYTFSPQYYKTDNSAHLNAVIKLRRYKVAFQQTAFFKARVTPTQRDGYEYTYSAGTTSGIIAGAPKLEEGMFTFPIMADARGVDIEMFSEEHLPVTLHSAEWEGFLQAKGQRI